MFHFGVCPDIVNHLRHIRGFVLVLVHLLLDERVR
jgi:hypothetical protein